MALSVITLPSLYDISAAFDPADHAIRLDQLSKLIGITYSDLLWL